MVAKDLNVTKHFQEGIVYVEGSGLCEDAGIRR